MLYSVSESSSPATLLYLTLGINYVSTNESKGKSGNSFLVVITGTRLLFIALKYSALLSAWLEFNGISPCLNCSRFTRQYIFAYVRHFLVLIISHVKLLSLFVTQSHLAFDAQNRFGAGEVLLNF
jgi:hypothetical protein